MEDNGNGSSVKVGSGPSWICQPSDSEVCVEHTCLDTVQAAALHGTYHFEHWKQSIDRLPAFKLRMSITFCRLLINFASDAKVPAWKGYLYAVLLFVVALIQALLLQQYFIMAFTVGMRIRTAVIAAVYDKVIMQREAARHAHTYHQQHV